MKMTLRALLPVALIPIVAFAARRQDSHSDRRPSPQDVNWTALMESVDRMHAAMASIERSGVSDVDFVRLMLPHHQGAIDMAKIELLNGASPEMRRLAQEIVTDQAS